MINALRLERNHFGVTVLVVDDNEQVREWMGATLLEAGYNVTFAGDGMEALVELRGAHFDVVITDVVMPNRDGFELIGDIRREWPNIRVIAVTGDGRGSTDGYLEIARGLGADASLAKPFGVAKLVTTVDAVLELRQADTSSRDR